MIVTKPAIDVRRSACGATDIYIRLYRKSVFLDRFSVIHNIKFHEKPAGERRVVTCGRADRQT